MAYIGQGIKSGTFSVLDTSGNTYNGSNVTFSLGTQVGSPAQLLVSHDGVIQKPGTDYTLATGGTQITFSTAPASGASIFIVEISGAVGGPLDSDLNGTELILDADGDTSITADTDDQIDFKIAGADDLRMTANAINVLSGTTLTIDSGATITNSGTASGFGVALDDVTTGDAAATLATSAGNITIDAQGNDTDIIFKGTDNTADTTFLTIDGSEGGDLLVGTAPKISSNGAIANFTNHNGSATETALASSDGNEKVRCFNDGKVTFEADGSERMRIFSSGHVAIGDTSDNGVFHAKTTANTDAVGLINSTNTSYSNRILVFQCSRDTSNNTYKLAQGRNGGGERFHIKDSGNLANTNNNYGSISDSRVKQNVEDANSQWDDIKALKIRKYKLKTYVNRDGADNTPYHLGVVAQELEAAGMNGLVEESKPEKEDVAYHSDFGTVVSGTANNGAKPIYEKDEEGNDTNKITGYEDVFTAGQNKKEVKYSILYMKAIKALQEAMAKIESLEARVTTLEG
jgi:hypothetical protein